MCKRGNNMKTVHGVGINDYNGTVSHLVDGKRINKKQYTTWSGMIKRCYNKKNQEKKPSYKGCTVCDEWLFFSKFKVWMDSKDHHGKHLDKDLMVTGNKVYSPSTCLFVSPLVNAALTNTKSTKGFLPTGVSLHSCGKFVAQISAFGKTKHLGLFASRYEAKSAYDRARYKYILELAELDDNPDISLALINYAGKITGVKWVGE